MVNKKGYLRVIESIIGIVLILIVIVGFLSKVPKEIAKTPPELELSSRALLKEFENNNNLRGTILRIEGQNSREEMERVVSFVEETLPPLSPIQFALQVCQTADIGLCTYYTKELEEEQAYLFDTRDFNTRGLPKNKDIFTKTLTISAEDVTSPPHESNNPVGQGKTLRI